MAEFLHQDEIDALLEVIEDDYIAMIGSIINRLNTQGDVGGSVTDLKVTYSTAMIKDIIERLQNIKSYIDDSNKQIAFYKKTEDEDETEENQE